MFTIYLSLLIIVGAIWFCINKEIINMRVVVEGVIIGVVSGLIISFVTDVDFRANVNGPFIKIAHIFNKQLRYSSRNWANIEAKQIETGVVSVNATNIASGSIVKFKMGPISALPPDLRYAVATGDVVDNKSIINIMAPKIDSAHVVGGSVVEIKEDKNK